MKMNKEFMLPTWLQQQTFSHLPSPAWNADYRERHWNKLISVGLPTKENERFKYMDWSLLEKNNDAPIKQVSTIQINEFIKTYRDKNKNHFLFIFIDGIFLPDHSDQPQLS